MHISFVLLSNIPFSSKWQASILQMHIAVLLVSSSRIWKELGQFVRFNLMILYYTYFLLSWRMLVKIFHLYIHSHILKCRPRAILDIIKSGENFRISTTTKMPEQGTCERCGYISSQVDFLYIPLNECKPSVHFL